MPNRCVVEGCLNIADSQQGISLHFTPFVGDEMPKATRRRKLWIDIVCSVLNALHRKRITHNCYMICMNHVIYLYITYVILKYYIIFIL